MVSLQATDLSRAAVICYFSLRWCKILSSITTCDLHGRLRVWLYAARFPGQSSCTDKERVCSAVTVAVVGGMIHLLFSRKS